MSYKSRLQEIYQKSKLRLPNYITEEAPQKLWISTVELYDESGEVLVSIEGRAFGTKKAAESDAAMKAIEYIDSNRQKLEKPKEKIRLDINTNVAILIDVENIPKAVPDFIDKYEPHERIHIYAFVSYKHPLAASVWPNYINKIIAPTSRPDGADICMTMYCSVLLVNNYYDEYIVITQDHFGEALVDLISTRSLIWEPKMATVLSSTNEISNLLTFKNNNS